MKKLTKIKLVNWHLFSDETVPIHENILVSGENGTGKSTLLDAVQYVLIGGKAGVKFNIAATDDAKRTLEGYVRGRIGAENKEFLRNGDVITHVAMEFFDERNNNYLILGVVLTLPLNGTLKDRFYLIKKAQIIDDFYKTDKKHPRDFAGLKQKVNEHKLEMITFDTQKRYRETLSQEFGIDAKRYSKILPKALAFRPTDLQKFIFDFLLDDDPVDISSLKNNVIQLKKVEAQIKLDQEKLSKLEKIVEIGEKIKDGNLKIETNKIIGYQINIDKAENQIASNKNLINKIDTELDGLKAGRDLVDRDLREVDASILELEKAKVNNDLSKTITGYQDALSNKQFDLHEQNEIVKKLRTNLFEEADLIEHLSKYHTDKSFDIFVRYIKSNHDYNQKQLIDYLSAQKHALDTLMTQNAINKSKTQSSVDKLSSEAREASNQLFNLKRNAKTYPNFVTNLISALNTELSRKFNTKILVQPLCEMLEVNDEEWRNALEGQLGQARFDIVVEPTYFDEALKIFDRKKHELGLYGVGLVNTEKLAGFSNPKPNSLATKVNSDFEYARLFANMLLGNIICVEDIKDLKNYQRSITKGCMTYANFTARQINPRNYQVPFIGKEASNIQIELYEAEISELNLQVRKETEKLDTFTSIHNLLTQSKTTLILNQNVIRYFDLIKKIKEEIRVIEDKLSNIKIDASLQEIENRLNIEHEKKTSLNNQRDLIVANIQTKRDEIERLFSKNVEIKETLETSIKSKNEIALAKPELLNISKETYAKLLNTESNYQAIMNHLAQDSAKQAQSINKHNGDLSYNMRAYISDYHFGAGNDYDQLIYFETEANNIKNNNLVKYQHQATELRKSSETSFKEEFVNKLRASIENAQQQFADLNHALRGKIFNSDSYELVYRASEDPHYKQYYNLIMGFNSDDHQALFTDSLTKKSEAILSELFEKISSSDPQFDKLTLEFLDYRNYMSYDIIVTNTNGNKSFFNKVSKEKSGGETQVPYYIVIAASFQQLLSRNKNADSGCVVLFDEAFNKMDESRIGAMLQFFNSLSIQLIISVPPDKVHNITPHVSTVIGIIKNNDYAKIIPYIKDLSDFNEKDAGHEHDDLENLIGKISTAK